MIIVKNRELLIPNNERYIGTTYDTEVENRLFCLDRFNQSGFDLSNLTFRLDMKYPSTRKVYTFNATTSRTGRSVVILTKPYVAAYPYAGTVTFTFNGTAWSDGSQTVDLEDIGVSIAFTPNNGDTITVISTINNVNSDTVLLTKEISPNHIYLTWEITESQTAVAGTVFVSLRGFNEDVEQRYASFPGVFYVEKNINSPDGYPGNLSELEQLEAAIADALKHAENMNAVSEDIIDDANAFALLSEAYAKGTRNDIPVSSGQAGYHNNSKYWSEVSHAYANQVSYNKIYSSVAEMVADTELIDGQTVRTLGYYAINDGGGSLYRIHSTATETYYETLANGLFAELITDGTVTAKQFGAKGDGVTDDSAAIISALRYAEDHGLVLCFPSGTYILNQTLQINADGVVIKGESPNLTRIHTSVTAIKSGLDISQSTLHRVSIENIFFNATANNIKIIDFGGFNYSRIENCIVGGTGKDNGCKGISCYGTGINGYYNMFVKNDIGSCDVGYDFKKPTITGITAREPNANLIIGGRIFSCNIGYHDTGEANKVFGSTFESNVVDIQVGYGSDSDADKMPGHPIIVGTYHEGGTTGVNALKISNATCRGTIWMPGYFTAYTNAVVDNGTASMLIFPSNTAALRMSMDGFTQIYDLLTNVLTVKAKTAYPTITMSPLSGATMLVQNANGFFRVYNSTSAAMVFRAYNTAQGKGVVEADIIRPGAVTTDERPVNGIVVGDMVFDKTLNKPIWRGNSGWVDATGASV